MQSLKDAFSKMNAGDASVHKMLAFWELPFDNWQRMVSSLSLVPGDVLRNVPTEGMRSKLDRVLGTPGLGYTREEQGQYQELSRAVLDYQETLAEYLNFFSRLGRRRGRAAAVAGQGSRNQAEADRIGPRASMTPGCRAARPSTPTP